MQREIIDRIIKEIGSGHTPPSLGYFISELQFSIIAEKAALNIHDWGWSKYVDYMNMWRDRADVKAIVDSLNDN